MNPAHDTVHTITTIPEKRPNYALRRGVAAFLLLGAGVSVAEGAHLAQGAVDNSNKQSQIEKHYSQPGLFDDALENGGVTDTETVITVQPGDVPRTIAEENGASDVGLVADELSGQAGGAGNLHPGDKFVIPSEQLGQ